MDHQKCTKTLKTLKQTYVHVCGKCVRESEHKTIGSINRHTDTSCREKAVCECVCVWVWVCAGGGGGYCSQKHAQGC